MGSGTVRILLALGWFLAAQTGWSESRVPAVPATVDGRPLLVGTTEVTQGLYFSVMGQNPSIRTGEQLPVEFVSWYDAVEFCNRLSSLEGLDPVYGPAGPDDEHSGWRLPTEREWEALAEAGGSPDPSAAWCMNNSERSTHPVGGLAPNSLGLFDLFGNVWEWCDSELPGGLRSDHGAGYRSSAALLTPLARGVQGPGSRADDLGFRIVRTVRSNAGDFSKDSK